uniref:Uncharacterized protein n=1 Tax=Romanomermis culicivorax TaxID=13658 RepID=A0A915KNC8_ROMCU
MTAAKLYKKFCNEIQSPNCSSVKPPGKQQKFNCQKGNERGSQKISSRSLAIADSASSVCKVKMTWLTGHKFKRCNSDSNDKTTNCRFSKAEASKFGCSFFATNSQLAANCSETEWPPGFRDKGVYGNGGCILLTPKTLRQAEAAAFSRAGVNDSLSDCVVVGVFSSAGAAAVDPFTGLLPLAALPHSNLVVAAAIDEKLSCFLEENIKKV